MKTMEQRLNEIMSPKTLVRQQEVLSIDGKAHVDGVEVFPVIINTICPVQYATEAQRIAFDHLTNVEQARGISNADQMLNLNLSPIGSSEVTHVFCSRFGFTNVVQLEVQTLAEQNLDWCGKREYTVNDDANEIKSLFCCVTGDRDTVLDVLGLQISN